MDIHWRNTQKPARFFIFYAPGVPGLFAVSGSYAVWLDALRRYRRHVLLLADGAVSG